MRRIADAFVGQKEEFFMKWIKRIAAMALTLCMLGTTLTGCGSQTEETASQAPESTPASSSEASEEPSSTPAEKITINIAAQKGPTGLGMVKLMQDSEDGSTPIRIMSPSLLPRTPRSP